MGKQFTVKSGFGPVTYSLTNPKYYNGGDTVILTDADYAALPASLTQTVVGVSTVAEPVYPAYPFTFNLTAVQQGDLVINVKNYGAKGDNATDDYASITNAITACPVGGIVYFPPGQYVVTNTLTIPSNITLRGSMATRWPQYGGIPVYIKPLFGSFSGTALFRATDTNGWRIENLTMQSGRAVQVGTGNPVHGLETLGACKAVRLQNVMINNYSGYGVHTDSNGNGWPGGWEVSNLNIMNCLAGGWRSDNSSAQTWALSDSVIRDSEAGANSDTGWYWAGLAATDFVGLRSTFNTANYGFAVVGSCNDVGFTECQTDRSIKDGFFINAPETLTNNAPAPHVIMLNGCHASRDGKNNGTQGGYAGFRIVGTSALSPCMPVILNGCQTHVSKDDGGTGQFSPDYGIVANFGSRVIVNGGVIQGTVAPVSDDNNAVIGGGGNTYNTINYSTGVITRDVGAIAAGAPQDNALPANIVASDYGYKVWSFDPAFASNASATTAGVLWLQRVNVRTPVAVTKVCYGVVSIAGLSLTSSQCFIGIYDNTGALVGQTADISAGFSAGNSELSFNLTGTVNLKAGQSYWVGILLNGTTLPTLARGQGQIGGLGNSQITNTKRFGTLGSAQTSLPGPITLSSIANASSATFWVGLV